MAKFNYKAAQKTALGLITKFGTSTTITRLSSTYDPVTGQESGVTATATPAEVVALPPGQSINTFTDTFKEELTQGKARFFYIAAKGLTLTPAPGDLIAWEGKIFDIVASNPLNPAQSVPVLYNVGARVSSKTIPSP